MDRVGLRTTFCKEAGKFIPSKGLLCAGCKGNGYVLCPHCNGKGVGPYHFGFFTIPKFCGLCGTIGHVLCPGCDGTDWLVKQGERRTQMYA